MSDALKVSVLLKGKELLSRTVATDRVMIGRGADCDLRLNEAGVSRHHAWIWRKEPCGYLLVDLRSSNGTIVGEETVTLMPIRDGARARISKFDLLFQLVDVPWEREDEPESPKPGLREEATLRLDGDESSRTRLPGPARGRQSRSRSFFRALTTALSSRGRLASD